MSTVQFETIQFSINMQFSSIWPIDRPEWIWEWWQWRGTPYSPKLQHYKNFTSRLFSVISRTLVVGWGSYSSAEMLSVYSRAPANWTMVQQIPKAILYLMRQNSKRTWSNWTKLDIFLQIFLIWLDP